MRVAEEYVPDWLDLPTMEWAAERCELMAARLLADGDSRTAYLGAEFCAHWLRAMLIVGADPRPAMVDASASLPAPD